MPKGLKKTPNTIFPKKLSLNGLKSKKRFTVGRGKLGSVLNNKVFLNITLTQTVLASQ
jgi:hypothetical protein